ncbi:hypothetical protein TNCV_3961551 [Trichonephila clavipes]|nr:hypothetical protein TNCV_3961551 [Trichonephila clavipes]
MSCPLLVRSELRDLSDDDNAELCILEEESSSDESDEEKHGNIRNGKTILDNSLPSKPLDHNHFIVLAVANSWFL